MPTSVLAYVAVALVVATAEADATDDADSEGSGLLDSGVETGRMMMSGASAV